MEKQNNFLVPKNTIKQNLGDLALDFANNLKEQSQAQKAESPLVQQLKNATIQRLMESMQPIATPKVTTLNDVLKSNDKLGTFLEYAQTPQGRRNIGNMFDASDYNPITGRFETFAEEGARKEETRIEHEKEQVRRLQEEQRKGALDVYKDFGLNEREAKALEAQIEQNRALMAFRERELSANQREKAFDRANAVQIAMMKGNGESIKPLSGSDAQKVNLAKDSLPAVQGMSQLIRQGMGPVGNNRNKYDVLKKRIADNYLYMKSGATATEEEHQNVYKMLPTPYELQYTPARALEKLQYFENSFKGTLGDMGQDVSQYTPISLPKREEKKGFTLDKQNNNINQKEIQAEMKRRGLK